MKNGCKNNGMINSQKRWLRSTEIPWAYQGFWVYLILGSTYLFRYIKFNQFNTGIRNIQKARQLIRKCSFQRIFHYLIKSYHQSRVR